MRKKNTYVAIKAAHIKQRTQNHCLLSLCVPLCVGRIYCVFISGRHQYNVMLMSSSTWKHVLKDIIFTYMLNY